MMRLFIGSVFLCLAFIGIEAVAEPDKACDGNWSIEFVKDENYTAWHSYYGSPVYPVQLRLDTVEPSAVTFTDNRERECYVRYTVDAQADAVYFNHCLPSGEPEPVPFRFKIRCEGDVLKGKTMSSRDVFKLRGKRVKD